MFPFIDTVNPLLSPPPLKYALRFQRRKVNTPPIPPPPPSTQSLFFTNNLRGLISYGLFVRLEVHIVFIVFGRMTSNFMYLIFSTLRSSSLWRLPQVNEILLTVTSTTHKSTLSPTRVFLLLVMRFAILNKPPPPSKVFGKNKPPRGGLMEDLQ